MSYMLCLAHYCDTHGPTPLMVTQGFQPECTICFKHAEGPSGKDKAADKKATGSNSQPPTPAASAVSQQEMLNLNRALSASNVNDYMYGQHATGLTSGGMTSPAPLDTPPDSPRMATQPPRRENSYRRTYDETVTKKQGPCDNCAMTLPRRQAGAEIAGSANARGPTLRTRAPAERVIGSGGSTLATASQTSSDTDSDHDHPRRPRHKRTGSTISSRDRSTSSNSTTSERLPFHVHYVDYTSTHQPAAPVEYSILRSSCLRALSFETLPRPPATSSPNSSPLNACPSPFVTTQSAGSAVSGGPIFFGDALAGYTTAYIFRIADVHARGHKRVYAFLALSTHKERLAMKTFAVISAAFRDLASWIQQLAEAEAERAATASPLTSVPQAAPKPQPAFDTAPAERVGSSFLTGGSGFTRRMGAGGGASAPKARGLAELVGQPDFFIELHEKFVRLLFEVGITLNS